MTEKLYLHDGELRIFEATVVSVTDQKVELDRTAFYATSGGQPNDTGHVVWSTGTSTVIDVTSDKDRVLHLLSGSVPKVGTVLTGTVDDQRRKKMMRTHTAMHILCGVIWRDWSRVVTGGNMNALSGRMDFEFNELPEGFTEQLEKLCNAEIDANRQVEISFIPRAEAVIDHDLIRTKVNLIPDHVNEIRVVDIVGLDKQADGGTHVLSTGAVGRLKITKTESKGKSFKRVRFVLDDH